jgi:hypothetical protein
VLTRIHARVKASISRPLSCGQIATGAPDPGTVTQSIEQDIISTLKEMIEALKRAQQKNWRTAGGEAVNRLKNPEKFDFGRWLKFSTYLSWAAQTWKTRSFPRKTAPAPPFLFSARTADVLAVCWPWVRRPMGGKQGFFALRPCIPRSGGLREMISPNNQTI